MVHYLYSQLTDADTIAITVTAVNDAPDLTNLAGDFLGYGAGSMPTTC